jgi:uncharacterized protein YgbK (DUF1537 family)
MGEKPVRLLIIADDLTGSNDAGVQFAKCGINSVVFVEHGIAELPSEYQVVVVNTESRHVGPKEAARRVRSVAKLGVRSGVTHFFKKTDSTLRGNIGAELQALMEVTGESSLPFVPAFPEMSRTTRNGIHYVHGIPIAESEFAHDPLGPVRESEVARVLRQTTDFPVTSAKLAEIPEAVRGCVLIDCETREDLTGIARELEARGKMRVLAGSAAFAEELPNVLGLKVEVREKVVAEGPILFVNGSLNPRALEQVGRVRGRLHNVRLSPDDVFGGGGGRQFRMGSNVLLDTLENREEEMVFRKRAKESGISESAIHLQVAEGIGRAVKEMLNRGGFKTLVVFGGDTLMGIARAMDWKAFVPRGEVGAGISVTQPMGSALLVVSKAGGFGGTDAAEQILGWIVKER